MPEEKVTEIKPERLGPEVLQRRHDGCRLVQICATRIPDGYELTYSFAKEYELEHLRIQIEEDYEIVSVSNIFAPAFLYENEIHDLFGVKIKLISLDYHGNLYRTEQKTPFKS